MSDYSELKRYIEDRKSRKLDTPEIEGDEILALIAENSSLRGSCKALGGRSQRAIKRANRFLKRKNARHVANQAEFLSSLERKNEEIEQLKAENEALRNLTEFRKQDLESLSIENYRLQKHIDEIAVGFKADVDSLRKDAERYRFLRDEQEFITAEFMILDIDSGDCMEAMDCLRGENLDSRVDSAMEKDDKHG